MKKIILCGTLILAGLSVQAEEIKDKDVPPAVKQKFVSLYPKVSEVEWELENGAYEAQFKENKVEIEVLFTKEGKLIQTETELKSISELPQAVQASLKKDFSNYEYDEIEKVKLADGTEQYKVDAEMKEKEYELLFDIKGMLISKTENKEDKE